MRGRKKEYASAAEKQAAYRARKNAINNVTGDVLRICPHCGGKPTEITGMGLNIMSVAEAHGGRGYICTECWYFTSVIPGCEPVTGQLIVRMNPAYVRARAEQGGGE